MLSKTCAVLLAICCSGNANAARIAVAPAAIIANPANGRGYIDLIVHSVGVRADAGERLTIVNVSIELMQGNRAILSQILTGDELVQDTHHLMGAPVKAFITGQLLSKDGLNGLFGAVTQAASSTTLQAGEALVTTGHYYTTNEAADSVRITCVARNSAGKIVKVERRVPLGPYQSPIDYHAPLKGAWLMQAIPTLQSHHRFNPPTEFAMDFFKIDAQGELAKGDPLIAANYYGYGADVLAAADGVVITVVDGEKQDRADLTMHPGEALEAAEERISAFNMMRYAKDFGRAAAGNLVVLRHEKDGRVEYSAYGHLLAGIEVKVGDHVKQGQLIAHVGDTGDSADVHLHFQINAGSDPFNSQSLPAHIVGLRDAADNSELGRMVVGE
jgi:hypothetical protein